MLFVAFGVDFGNLRHQDTAEPRMADLCQAWNGALHRAGFRVVHWWHKTGNFIVDGGRDVAPVN
jgi:hypothetical protein